MEIKRNFIRKGICSQYCSAGSFKDLKIKRSTQQGASLLVRSKGQRGALLQAVGLQPFNIRSKGKILKLLSRLSPLFPLSRVRGGWWDSSTVGFSSRLVVLTGTFSYVWRYFWLSKLWRLILSFVIVGQWYILQSTRKNCMTQNSSSQRWET